MINNIFQSDFLRSLPDVIKKDTALLAFCRAVSDELKKLINDTRLAIIYPRIDELGEDVIDILANDFHIDWYDYGFSLEKKRQIVKNSVRVHMYMGTRYAIETAMKDASPALFDNVELRMWYEYNGNPGYFKIVSTNPDITNANFEAFMKILNAVKELSAWLEGILIGLTGEFNAFAGMLTREHTREIHTITNIQ